VLCDPSRCGFGDGGIDGWIERGSSEAATTWKHVGEGRGQYDKVNTFDYVGEGRGAYTKQRRSGWVLGKYGILCVSLLALVGAVLLFIRLCQREEEVPTTVVPTSAPLALPAAPPLRGEPMLFNCSYSFFGERWSHEKNSWCCDHVGVGCTTTVTTFTTTTVSTTTSTTLTPATSWMYISVTLATTTTFLCDDGVHANWRDGWSLSNVNSRKEWCCRQMGISCGTASIAPTTAPFDCAAGTRWQSRWSDAKQSYCCSSVGVGCTDASSTTYDCTELASDWEVAWSNGKKAYCCKQVGTGCPATAVAMGPEPTVASPVVA